MCTADTTDLFLLDDLGHVGLLGCVHLGEVHGEEEYKAEVDDGGRV